MEKHEYLVALFDRAKQAHIDAFQETGGDDPDWPSWYAGYILADLERLFGAEYQAEEIANLFVRADQEYRASGSQESWMEYYARYFTQSLG
jgi:hypothetical protein